MPPAIEHTGVIPPGALTPEVTSLVLDRPADAAIDLTGSGLVSVTVREITAPLHLRLPESLRQVILTGTRLDAVQLSGLAQRDVAVQLWGDLTLGFPSGLESATALEIHRTPSLDLSLVTHTPRLTVLTVHDVPGPVTAMASLRQLSSLERLGFQCTYDLEADALPSHQTWPHLQWISFDEVSAGDARALRAAVAGFFNGHVRAVRSPAWLNRHRGNPFSTWNQDDPGLGRKAMHQWWRARSHLMTTLDAGERAAIIGDLVRSLGALCEPHPLDTLRREQLGEAIRGLAVEFCPGSNWQDWTPD